MSDHAEWLRSEAADYIERQAAELAEARQELARLMDKHNALHMSCHGHRAEAEALRAEVARLRAAGGLLSNVAFNLSQEANETGKRLTPAERAMLKSLQIQWDTARAAIDTARAAGAEG